MQSKFIKYIEFFWGLFLTFLITCTFIFKPGYVFFTDLVHGPNRDNAWTGSGLLLQSSIVFFDKIFGSEISIKLIYFLSIFFIYFVGVFLVKQLTENKYIQVFIGSFALMNLFVYERILYGQLGVVLAYAFYVLFFVYLLRVFYFVRREHVAEIKSIFTNKSVLFSGLFAGLTIDSSIHTIFFILFTIKIFFLIYILDLYLNFYKKNIIDLQNFIRKIFSKIIENIYIIFLSLLVNISFLINTILGKNEIAKFTEKAISSLDLNAFQTIGGNIFEKIFNVLSLTGFWGREQFRFIDITDNPLWFLGFLPFVFLIIFGIYKMYFANFKLFLISILFIVFVPILAVATSIESLDFMYKYIPFYTGLREPHKWTMLLIPIYLIAMFFGLRNTSHLENKNSVIIFFILLLFIFQYKFLFGFWGQMRAVEYPSSWYKIEEIIKKENLEKYSTECAGENLFLPWHLYMSFKFAGNVIANPATYFFSCPIVSGTNMEFGGIFDNNKNDTSTKYGFWLFEDNKNLPPNETNFIIVSKDVDFERYNWLRERGFIQNIFEDDNLILYKVKN